MKFKKILIYLIFIYLFYVLYKKIITSNSIEHFKTDFMYYSNECKKKSQIDPNLHKYSINYIDNVYSTKNENNPLNKYYKSLGDALGNIDEVKKTNNNTKEIQNNKNNNDLVKNSVDLQNNSQKKVPEYSTCKTPKKKIIIIKNNKKTEVKDSIEKYSEDKNTVLTIEFQKIISLDIDINTDDQNKNDYYHELSNDYFNNIFRIISSNNYKPLIDFIDKTNELTDILYEKYLLIEKAIINKINMIDELKIENSRKFKVVQRYIKSYLYSETTDNSYVEFDILIYRAGKNNGKHINIIASLDKNQVELINISVIGLVIESDIMLSVIPYDNIKDEEMLVEDNNEEAYSLIKMSDFEVTKYIEQHENQLTTRI